MDAVNELVGMGWYRSAWSLRWPRMSSAERAIGNGGSFMMAVSGTWQLQGLEHKLSQSSGRVVCQSFWSGCCRREEEARVEREAAQQEAAAAARMRRAPQTHARVEAQAEAKSLVAHPVRATSISDDGSESSVRYDDLRELSRSLSNWTRDHLMRHGLV